MVDTDFTPDMAQFRFGIFGEDERLLQPGDMYTPGTSPLGPSQSPLPESDTTIFISASADRPPSHLLQAPGAMATARKFSYASVKEESGEDLPQSFESSLSTQDLEEVEWIAWPCSQWCKTKGLCSYHSGGTHEEYVQARLEGYARSNPRKLEKILDELDKRRLAHKLYQSSFSADVGSGVRPLDFSLDVWREKIRALSRSRLSTTDVLDEAAVDDEDDVLPPVLSTSSLPTPIHKNWSPLECLPLEILDLILSYVTIDQTADPYARPRVDLASCSLVSKRLNTAALRVMYRHVSIPQSRAFAKFTRSLNADNMLGQLVHWLDFSHYSSIGFGRARSTTTKTPFLTPQTLKACLDLMPNLQAFLVHEHVDDELDVEVLLTLFRTPSLQALDFCACSSKPFAEAFTTVCTGMSLGDHTSFWDSFPLSLQRLSLHECTTLQEPVFEALLPRLVNLTHLDVAHTLVNDAALLSIPTSASLTHLNLERCTRLTGAAVVQFLTKHPAVHDKVVYLNLSADASRHRLLSENDVSRLLPALPSTLRSLNLGGARINTRHVPALRRLATQLEELGLKGANLSLSSDLSRIFGVDDHGRSTEDDKPRTLRYIDLTDVGSVTQMSLSYSPATLTSTDTLPLEVIELGPNVLDQFKKRNRNAKDPEWVIKELGRRGWYVRQARPDEKKPMDDGYRSWKMGARWWGMRKIPMAEQVVGGMYGYFMFKRN